MVAVYMMYIIVETVYFQYLWLITSVMNELGLSPISLMIISPLRERTPGLSKNIDNDINKH